VDLRQLEQCDLNTLSHLRIITSKIGAPFAKIICWNIQHTVQDINKQLLHVRANEKLVIRHTHICQMTKTLTEVVQGLES
jgi:hypothetical protein